MRYSLEAGGKRLRPILLLAAADLFPAAASARAGDRPDPLPAAVAIECIHTYSLIHDDLPCMDDDDLRRGRPTAHKAFDEATALLAGDALLTHAFALLAGHYPGPLAAALVRELAEAAGSARLIGGQMEDLLAEKIAEVGPEEIHFIHLHKTAAMIEASLAMGGWIGLVASGRLESAAWPPILETLREAGRHLGLAFQAIDDVLDATADTATLGKTAGKDERDGKATLVKARGLDAARQVAADESAAAIAALRRLPGDSDFLVALAEQMQGRRR
jgi:geranylgeranyl pyrophosphate synthase